MTIKLDTRYVYGGDLSAPAATTTPVAPVLIGLTGFARSGKDTAGVVLVERHGFRRVAFGDTLKDVAEDMNPILEYKADRGDGELAVRRTPLDRLLASHGGREGLKDAIPEYRVYLVDLGNSLRHRIPGVEIAASFGNVQPGDRVVNTNVYHPEEIDAIRAMGGIVIRVTRPDWSAANPDEARTGLHPVDVTIANDGTVEDLAVKVAATLDALGVSLSSAA